MRIMLAGVVWLCAVSFIGVFAAERAPEGLVPPADARSLPVHGLDAAAARKGWRFLEHTQRADGLLSERTIFRDSVTGGIVWRMTCDPAVDASDYYDIPAWNADGTLMSFMTRREASGEKLRWLMDADATNLRPFTVAGSGANATKGYWSIKDPKVFYQFEEKGDTKRVLAVDPLIGASSLVVEFELPYAVDMMPPHPSEDYFLFGSRGDDFQAGSAAFVVGRDGSIRRADFEKRWHRLRFSKRPDQRLFFNFDEPREQFSILPDGTDRYSIPRSGSHPDWTTNGAELTFYHEGKVWGIQYDGTGIREIIDIGGGGHGGPCLDGTWFVSDQKGGDFANSVFWFRTDGSQIAHILSKHDSAYYSHSVTWHPDHHTSHPHPVASPDTTKVLYNSDFLAPYTDIYVAIAHMPDPPQELTASTNNGGCLKLEWKAPWRSRETKGYVVYRSTDGGIAYIRATTEPIRELQWQDPDATPNACYVVAAVEHSGLEGMPSVAAYAAEPEWAYVRIEAESGKATVPMRETFEPTDASNLYCVGTLESGGLLDLEVALPKQAAYYVWARVRGAGAVQVACNGAALGEVPCKVDAWTWQRTQAHAASGTATLRLEAKGAAYVDMLMLTNDPNFTPEGRMAIDSTPPPRVMPEVAALSNNALRISWTAPEADDVDHYNVYCGDSPGFACNQRTLVGSPSDTEFVDWGLGLNTQYYYHVTAVDRAGNESEAFKVASGATPDFTPTTCAFKVAEPAEKSWDFEVPEDGLYAIWANARHEEKRPTQAVFTLDGEAKISFRAWGPWGEWGWSPAGIKSTGTPQLIALKRGKHTLSMDSASRGAEIQEICVTNNPLFP